MKLGNALGCTLDQTEEIADQFSGYWWLGLQSKFEIVDGGRRRVHQVRT